MLHVCREPLNAPQPIISPKQQIQTSSCRKRPGNWFCVARVFPKTPNNEYRDYRRSWSPPLSEINCPHQAVPGSPCSCSPVNPPVILSRVIDLYILLRFKTRYDYPGAITDKTASRGFQDNGVYPKIGLIIELWEHVFHWITSLRELINLSGDRGLFAYRAQLFRARESIYPFVSAAFIGNFPESIGLLCRNYFCHAS